MKHQGLLIALGWVVIINAFVLAGVAYNRSGEPTTSIVMTERELPGYSGLLTSAESTEHVLLLNWNTVSRRPWDWLDQDKLKSVGFELDDLPTEFTAWPSNNKHLLPKKAFGVLEYEGESWARYIKDNEYRIKHPDQDPKLAWGDKYSKHLRDQLEHYKKAGTRLFMIDVGKDADSLRARYPDMGRYIIVPIEVVAKYQWFSAAKAKKHGKWRLTGGVRDALRSTIHVPKSFHKQLKDQKLRGKVSWGDGRHLPQDAGLPRYRVSLKFGQRYEPWVENIELISRKK